MLRKLQQGRAVLMGFAILWIIAYHYNLLDCTPARVFFGNGFLGVEIFIILSAFGLCFSLSKDDNYKRFIQKRILRIFPTWWILISVLLIISIIHGKEHPQTLFQYICYYSGLGWWFFSHETPHVYWSEWYVPTILVLYLVIPYIYKLNNKALFINFILFLLGGGLLTHYEIASSLAITYVRIPALIYGVLLYRWYKMEQEGGITKPHKLFLYTSLTIGIIGILLISTGVIDYDLEFIKWSFMLSMPIFSYLIVVLFEKLKLTSTFTFIGGLTLELYLLHIRNTPLLIAMKVIPNKTIAVCVTMVLLVFAAYYVQKIISFTTKYISKKFA